MTPKVEVEVSNVDYRDPRDNTVLEGLLCKPKKLQAKVPAILVVHTYAGITEFEEERCRALAELGFVAFAADIYGKGNRGKSRDECFALFKKYKEDRALLLRGRLNAALDTLKAFENVDAEKIAVIGFCFGGMCALDLARINAPGILAAVSFHGVFFPLPDQTEPEKVSPITASVLICHGDSDIHIPQEQCNALLAELRARKADWQMISYGNAKHGFTEPRMANSDMEGVGYDEKAARRSWATMLALFSEKFGQH